MNIYALDFEEVLKNYTGYHQSLEAINQKKEEFTQKIDGIKNEMEKLIKSANSLILDDKTKEMSARKFKELQQQGMMVESEFRTMIGDFQNTELEKNFKEITDLVNQWVSEEKEKVGHEIDFILNKNQTVFIQNKHDITSLLIDYLKSKELYHEYVETETVNTIDNE